MIALAAEDRRRLAAEAAESNTAPSSPQVKVVTTVAEALLMCLELALPFALALPPAARVALCVVTVAVEWKPRDHCREIEGESLLLILLAPHLRQQLSTDAVLL